MRETSKAATALAVLGVVLVAAVGAGTAATASDGQHSHAPQVDPPAFVVALHEDGSARLTVTYSYNLSDSDRAEAFRELRNSTSVRADFRDRFENRLSSVANASENVTGREMTVRNATLVFRVEDETGIVAASVTWEGLAAVDGDQLTVTEPFASGFESERPVHVFVPDDYTVASVTPTPDVQSDGHLRWDAGTNLEGFELVVTAPDDSEMDGTATPTPADGDGTKTPASDGTTTGGGQTGPGFGVVAAALALLGAGLLAAWRR